MKLELGKSYTVYTTSDYITNKQIRILGILSYEEASQYSNFIENVSINETFIDNAGDTESYLKKQKYYKCGTIVLADQGYAKTGETLILWDDIIDSDRTVILYEDHVYKLAFKLKNIESTDNITKSKIISTINEAINLKYNGIKEKVEVSIVEIFDNSISHVETQLEKTQIVLDSTVEALKSFISMKDEAKKISNNIVNNDIVTRMLSLESSLTNIEDSISIIQSKLM